MNHRVKRELREYAKALIGMFAGALVLAYVELCWAAHHNFFLVRKADAQARRQLDEAYTRMAVCPIDEMSGEGP